MRTRSQRRPAATAAAVAVEQLEGRRLFAFGVTTGTAATGQSTYVVDNGGDVKFAVIRGGSLTSTIHMGDVTSIQYKAKELLAPYATTSRYSHYEQGLGSTAAVTYTTGGTAGSRWILVTANDSAAASGAVIQYYAVRENDSNLYMASLPVDVNNGPGEGRFIAYLSRNVFATPEEPSDNAPNSATDTVTAIEGSDVFGHSDGTTSSKFYNMGRRMIENEVHGLTGSASGTAVGAWMHMGNRERSAGGPFFKDIDFQSSSAVELYNCIFTGHTQTESYRQGLHTYAMQLNGGGAAPAAPNYSFLETMKDASGNLLISGLVPAAQRGAIVGTATGNPAGHETVVTLSNADAQYWDMADASGNYAITGVLPGTYTETIFDNELEVGTRTVTIAAGKTTAANIANAFYVPAAPIFRIGTWDGTPVGFLNADKIETMHPSDSRMSSWTATPNFVVGTNTDAQFAMAQFMGVNNSQRITFNLSSAQALTFRVGITLGFEGARPRITVNGGQTYAWTSGIPTASRDLNSRGVTRGTWRGDNQLYTFSIPSTAFRAGVNTIDMGMVSGSFVSGQTWLSPNAVFDAIDLVPTSSANPTSINSVTVTPANSSVGVNGSKPYAAVARTATGGTLVANLDWSATRGTIDPGGNYVAPSTAGSDTVTAVARLTRTPGYSTGTGSSSVIADSITLSGSTGLTVTDAAPTVATAASAAPTPTYGRQVTLSVLGADDGGESNLTYTWSVLGTPPASVTFGATNGTNAGKGTTATFTAPGTYAFQVTIADATGKTVTSQASVTFKPADTRYAADETGGTTLADATGNGNAATLTGSTAFAAGVNGNAVKFTGGYATLPAGIVSGLDDFTIGAWVKPDSLTNAWQRVFDFGSGTSSYMFLTTKSATGGVRFAIKANAAAAEQIVDGPALTVGAWTHLAVTLQGNTATLYVNGVAVGTNTGVTTHPAALGATANNYLGKSQFAADAPLAASVDDFRIASRALSSTEVAALAKPAAPTDLAATAGNAQVALSWTAAAGATSYSVKRSTTDGGPYTTVVATGLTGTTYTDTTAANGTTYYYVVAAVNAGASTDSAQASATPVAPLAPAPTLTSFAVNDGAAQRSMVRSLTLTFSKPVTLSNSAVSLSNAAGAAVAFTLTPGVGNSSGQYVLTFGGSGIVGGSLADGVYTLTLNGSGVAAAGSAQMTGTSTYVFHRLFGDSDGDKDVDNLDSLRFRTALNSTSGASAYRDYFDFDFDGDVDNLDSLRFRTRLNTAVSY